LQSAIDITLQRFAEYHSLQGAFGRRATIEQAKGILMARHAVDADRAFDMLRDHSQHNGHKLVDVAQAIVDSPPPAAAAARTTCPGRTGDVGDGVAGNTRCRFGGSFEGRGALAIGAT